ncbi:MAG TPA: hypothetical protein VD736_02750 [Nitrososphaera sp.]|nr:hypothetical protein [Nitrososphaera sp.]
MNNKMWFGCPKCFLAFYSKGEYEHHYESDHRGRELNGADLMETKG